MLRAKRIKDLILQPKYLLQEGFKRDNKTYKAIYYIADFEYMQDNKKIVEDVKGFKTKEYLLKKKLFLKNYPQVEFKEIWND